VACVVQEKVIWQRLRQMYEEKISFNVTVVEGRPAGVRVVAYGRSGFIPFSHLPNVGA
jgi:ribosomal protein S1